jgi:hypothetical protein
MSEQEVVVEALTKEVPIQMVALGEKGGMVHQILPSGETQPLAVRQQVVLESLLAILVAVVVVVLQTALAETQEQAV